MTFFRRSHYLAAWLAWLAWAGAVVRNLRMGHNPGASRGDLPVELLVLALALSLTLRLWERP